MGKYYRQDRLHARLQVVLFTFSFFLSSEWVVGNVIDNGFTMMDIFGEFFLNKKTCQTFESFYF